MNPEILARKHAEGLTYAEYVCTGSDSQQENWKTLYDQAVLTDPQQRLLASFTRRINVIALSGIWCGDCVQQGPLIARIAEAAPTCISLRWLDRDAHMDLQESVSINAGHRVPVLIFCAEDFELVGWHGDRTLNRLRPADPDHPPNRTRALERKPEGTADQADTDDSDSGVVFHSSATRARLTPSRTEHSPPTPGRDR